MFDCNDNKLVFSGCTAVLAAFGLVVNILAWGSEAPRMTLLWSLFFFALLIVVLFVAVTYASEWVAYVFPLAVLLAYRVYIPVLDWLAGIRALEDFPLRLDVAWYGVGWVQMLIGVFIVALGYVVLWKAGKLHFPA